MAKEPVLDMRVKVEGKWGPRLIALQRTLDTLARAQAVAVHESIDPEQSGEALWERAVNRLEESVKNLKGA